MDFKFTWKEFCLLETYFKTKLSELLHQNDGSHIMFSQVYLNNFDENCPAPMNSTEKASLLFYIIKPGGTFEDVDKEMTKHAFKVLHYLVENKLGRLIGPLFELKINRVRAIGADAPPEPTHFTEMERTYIAIGIAWGVIAIIILILVAVHFIKKKSNHHPASKTTGEENQEIEIIESPPLNANEPLHVYNEAYSSGAAETKF